MSFQKWLQRREYGLPANMGDRDFIMKRVYSSLEMYHEWNDFDTCPNLISQVGSVFNLEFSPEGNILVAACEKKTILLFDSITQKQTNKITDAHTDNVNCIRFLDDRMFATCSDDATVALWDLRNLKRKQRSLHGHSNWVKNIEYSHKDNLLVTSGFDGSIFTWDINSHTEQGLIYQKVFHTSGLMRCRISPDGDKMVICTTGGYMMIIHHLDLTTLHKDLCGFRPGIYRLMQMGNQYIPQAAKFDHVFSKEQKKNRVELITDFPEENDAEVILALQIHPQGHCVLSRNISYDELTEWSCVHDIKEEPDDAVERIKEPSAKRKRRGLNDSDSDDQQNRATDDSNDASDNLMFSGNRRRYTQLILPRPSSPPFGSTVAVDTPHPRADVFVPDIWAAEVTVQERAIRQNRVRNSNSVTGYNFVYAISSGVLPLNRNANASTNSISTENSNNSSNNSNRLTSATSAAATTTTNSTRSRSASTTTTSRALQSTQRATQSPPIMNYSMQPIFQNPKKLLYYIQESNKDKGFIKEPCFSMDGRIICSPYYNGVRLFAYNSECSEYPRNQQFEHAKRSPKPLVEIVNIANHDDVVLSTKFSPREPLLVTGCQGGRIIWYHPNL